METSYRKPTFSEGTLEKLKSDLENAVRRSMEILCLNAILTSCTIELSRAVSNTVTEESNDRRHHVDLELLDRLIKRNAINWTGKTAVLVPLLQMNRNGGSGLLRCVAIALWGVADEDVESFLQRLTHVTLTTGRRHSTFKERWKLEEEDYRLRTDDHQTNVAWEDVCSIFQNPSTPSNLSRSDCSIEPIHVFSLANVLRRPILVIDDISSNPKNLTGIYLPLLSNPESCVPYPIVIVRHERVFSPLVIDQNPCDRLQSMRYRSVPIVKPNHEPIPIRCLLATENHKVGDLMLSYLKIAEITAVCEGGESQILTARLSPEKLLGSASRKTSVSGQRSPSLRLPDVTEARLDEDDVSVSEGSVSQRGESKSQSHANCLTNEYSTMAQKHLENYQEVRKEERNLPNVPCSYEKCSVFGCEREASAKYGNRCIACFVTMDSLLEYPTGFEDQKAKEACRRVEFKEFTGHTFEESIQKPFCHTVTFEHSVKDKTSRTEEETPGCLESKDDRSSRKAGVKFSNGYDVQNFKTTSETNQNKIDITNHRDPGILVTPEERLANLVSSSAVPPASGRNCPVDQQKNCTSEVVQNKNSYVEAWLHTTELPPKGEVSVENTGAKCVVDFCKNIGDKSFNGLCGVCYKTLAEQRLKNQEVFSPPLSHVSESDSRCLTEGCKEVVINRQLGLCLPCLRIQIFAARDLDRKTERRHSQKQSSTRSHHQTHDYAAGAAYYAPGGQPSSSSKRRTTAKSSSDDIRGSPTLQRVNRVMSEGSSHHKSQVSRAKLCLGNACDRYGDPSYDGLCSVCYGKRKTSFVVS